MNWVRGVWPTVYDRETTICLQQKLNQHSHSRKLHHVKSTAV